MRGVLHHHFLLVYIGTDAGKTFDFDRGLSIPPRARAAPNDQKHDQVIYAVIPDLSGNRRRVLKVLAEMYLCGFTQTNFAADIIATCIARAHQLRRPLAPQGLELMANIGNFFKAYGREFLGFPSRTASKFAEDHAAVLEDRPIKYSECRVEQWVQDGLRDLLESYTDSLVKILLSKAKDLRARHKHNQNTLLLRGELSEERQDRYKTMKDKVEKLDAAVAIFTDVLDREPLEVAATLEKEEAEAAAAALAESAEAVAVWNGKMEHDDGPFPTDGPFADRETQRFYCNLLDLRTDAGIPAVFLEENDSHSGDREKIRKEREAAQEAELEAKKDQEEKTLSEAAKRQIEARKRAEEKKKEEEFDETEYFEDLFGTSDGRSSEKTDTRSAKLEQLLLELPNCYRKDLIDNWAVEFCYVNSKANRKRLAQALYRVRWSSLELLPFYARLVATLNQVFPDLKVPLVEALRRQFHGLLRSKDQKRLGSKIKNARFIGELVKFQIAPPILAFNCLKSCFYDFKGHTITVCCALVETCGRWLYKVPMQKVNEYAAKMLTTMMNMKRSKFLDQTTAYMIESAYQEAVPSAGHAAIVVKQVPLLHKYLKYLLVGQRFDEGALNAVVMRLRKLRWGVKSVVEQAKVAPPAAAATTTTTATEDGGEGTDEEKTDDNNDGIDPLDAAAHAAIGAENLLPALTKYILSTCRGGRLDTIRTVCRLLLRLKRYRATLVVRVVDELLERIYHGVRCVWVVVALSACTDIQGLHCPVLSGRNQRLS